MMIYPPVNGQVVRDNLYRVSLSAKTESFGFIREKERLFFDFV